MRHGGLHARLPGRVPAAPSGLVRAAARPGYSRNREAEAYLGAERWTEPAFIHDGLALYSRGSGPDLLLLPYPHAATSTPMIDSPLAASLAAAGFRVLSFDPPGSYRSTRKPRVDMPEMIACARETLDRSGVHGAAIVVGHSMGAFAALAFAVEEPSRVSHLVLEGGLSGFPSSTRHGLPGRHLGPGDKGYGLFTWGGMRIAFGLADMALMKRFLDFYDNLLIVDPRYREPFPLRPESSSLPVPVRARWTLNLFRRLDYSRRLGEVKAPTLILVGEKDLQTPVECSRELAEGITGSRLVVFPGVGHAPHLEAERDFRTALRSFLGDGEAWGPA